jgi:hypothetical protein
MTYHGVDVALYNVISSAATVKMHFADLSAKYSYHGFDITACHAAYA